LSNSNTISSDFSQKLSLIAARYAVSAVVNKARSHWGTYTLHYDKAYDYE